MTSDEASMGDLERRIVEPRDLEFVRRPENAGKRGAIVCAVTTYRRPDRLAIGDRVPALELQRLTSGGTVKLDASRGKPLVLIFGSYT